MKNKELKKELLKEKVLVKFEDDTEKEIELFKEYSHMRYKMFQDGLDKETIKANMIAHYGEEKAIALEQMSNSKIKQKAKIKDHISYLVTRSYDSYFITLTIRDNVLNIISDSALQKRINRALSDFDDFIYNVDFGSETERKHYHAFASKFWMDSTLVVNAKKYYESIGETEIASKIKNKRAVVIKTSGLLNYMKNTGFVYAEPVRTSNKSQDKLSEYIAKLTAHSLKVKQTYVSTKKGSNYQKYCRLNEKAKKKNAEQIENRGRYIPLINTIRSSVELFKAYRELGEFPEYEVYSHLDLTEDEKRILIEKHEKAEAARKRYFEEILEKNKKTK